MEMLMLFRTLGLFAALAMLGSLFLPWLTVGPPLVPWDAIKSLIDLDPQLRSQMFQTMPPTEIITFGLSFIAALLFLLTSASSRLLAFLAGVLPFATAAILFTRAGNPASGFGADLPDFNAPDFSQQLSEFYDIAGPGLTLWFGSAAVLLLIGLLFSPSPGR
jgi:hypothetical protein